MYKLLRGLGHLLARLKPSWIEKAAMVMAVICFDLLRVRRRTIMKNLKIAYGGQKTPREMRQIGRHSIYHFLLSMAEFFRSVATDITENVTIIGREHADQALAQGNGAYILCFHMGNWEAMGAAYTKHIAPAHVLVKKVGRGGVAAFVDKTREHNGFLTVKRQKKGDGMKAIQDVLAAGEMVGFVIDQARPGEPRLPFFSEPAKTNTSFAAIWARVQAPIIPSYITRDGLGRHVLRILPAVELDQTSDPADDILRHSVQFNRIVESVVRSRPEQYFWMHNRWKA